MLTISQIPTWLQCGEFFRNIMEIDPLADTKMVRPLKTTFDFNGLSDVLEMLDTCLYMDVDTLPAEVYRYCRETPELILEMDLFEKNTLEKNGHSLEHYEYFITTTEYNAFRICVESQTSVCDSNGDNALLDTAIRAGNMSLVRYCVEDCGACNMDDFSRAVEYSRIDICKYILRKFKEWLTSIQMSWLNLHTAAVNGDLQMLQYLHEQVGVWWYGKVIQDAMYHRKIECVLYAIKNGCPIPKYALDLAIEIDSLELVKVFIEHDIDTTSPYTLNFALQLDRLDISRLLYESGARPNENTIYCASEDCIAFAQEIINKNV